MKAMIRGLKDRLDAVPRSETLGIKKVDLFLKRNDPGRIDRNAIVHSSESFCASTEMPDVTMAAPPGAPPARATGPEPSSVARERAIVPGQVRSSRNLLGSVPHSDCPRPELLAVHEFELDVPTQACK